MRPYGDDRLRELLAELEASAPAPPPPELRPQPSVERWRLALAAVVIPLALLGGYVLFGLVDRPSVGESTPPPSPSVKPSGSATSSPEPSPPIPSATEVASATPIPLPTNAELSGWRTAEFGGPGSIEYAADIAPWAGGFVSVGTHYDAAQMPSSDPPPEHEGRVWVSPDGSTWEDATQGGVFGDVELGHVFVLPDEGIVVVGRTVDPDTGRHVSRAWGSGDARTWSGISLTGIGVDTHILEVEAGARGYLAAGISGTDQGPSIWYSADGLTWELTRDEAPGTAEVSREELQSIGAGEEGFVVVLSHEHTVDGREVTAIASADGRNWVVGDTPPAYFAGVAPIGSGWLLLAWDRVEPEPAATTFRTWSSADGLAWVPSEDLTVQPIAIDESAITCSRSDLRLSAAGDVVIASLVAAAPCSEGGAILPAGAWSYIEGSGWTSLPVEGRAFVAGAAPRDGLLILAGHIGRDDARATFWLGAPD